MSQSLVSAIPTLSSNGACLNSRDRFCASATDKPSPGDVFAKLRWGGQFVFTAASAKQARSLASEFALSGFDIESPPAASPQGRSTWRKFLPHRRQYGFVARKTHLLPPGETTDRFTYDVHLERHP